MFSCFSSTYLPRKWLLEAERPQWTSRSPDASCTSSATKNIPPQTKTKSRMKFEITWNKRTVKHLFFNERGKGKVKTLYIKFILKIPTDKKHYLRKRPWSSSSSIIHSNRMSYIGSEWMELYCAAYGVQLIQSVKTETCNIKFIYLIGHEFDSRQTYFFNPTISLVNEWLKSNPAMILIL